MFLHNAGPIFFQNSWLGQTGEWASIRTCASNRDFMVFESAHKQNAISVLFRWWADGYMIFQWGPVPLSHMSKYYLPCRTCEEHTSLDSPVYHILPYVSGGLERLLHRIKTDAVPELAGKNLFYRPPDKRL